MVAWRAVAKTLDGSTSERAIGSTRQEPPPTAPRLDHGSDHRRADRPRCPWGGRDLDPQNDLTFLRIRTKKHEMMVAPEKDFLLIVVQDPNSE